MPKLTFLYSNEKKKLIEKLGYYGITELPYLLVESGKEKIRGYSGNLSIEEIQELNNEIGLELIGMYLFNEYDENVRLSFDAVQALKHQITKNILQLDEKQAEEFMKGRDILLSKEEIQKFESASETKGFKVIKNKGNILGIGKLVEGRIVNYMPKERRLR